MLEKESYKHDSCVEKKATNMITSSCVKKKATNMTASRVERMDGGHVHVLCQAGIVGFITLQSKVRHPR